MRGGGYLIFPKLWPDMWPDMLFVLLLLVFFSKLNKGWMKVKLYIFCCLITHPQKGEGRGRLFEDLWYFSTPVFEKLIHVFFSSVLDLDLEILQLIKKETSHVIHSITFKSYSNNY